MSRYQSAKTSSPETDDDHQRRRKFSGYFRDPVKCLKVLNQHKKGDTRLLLSHPLQSPLCKTCNDGPTFTNPLHYSTHRYTSLSRRLIHQPTLVQPLQESTQKLKKNNLNGHSKSIQSGTVDYLIMHKLITHNSHNA